MALYCPHMPWSSWRELTCNSVHTRSVSELSYERDKAMLGRIGSRRDGDHLSCSDSNGEATYVYCMDFSSCATNRSFLATGTEEGEICLIDAGADRHASLSGKVNVAERWDAHRNAIFDVCWSAIDSNRIVSVSGDRTAVLWDVDRTFQVRTFLGYQGSVKCVQFAPDSPDVFITGSRDNRITRLDARTSMRDGRGVNVIKDAHGQKAGGKKSSKNAERVSITAVLFIDDVTIVSCSDSDGLIKIWDLRKSYDRYKGLPVAKHCIPYAGISALRGYSSMLINSARSKVYASCKDHKIYCFDVVRFDSDEPAKVFSGHVNGSKFFTRLSLSIDDVYLASGSSDNFGYIWNTSLNTPSTPVGRLNGHEDDVTCVNFSKQLEDPYKIATCSDDYTLKLWGPDQRSHTTGRIATEDGVFEVTCLRGDYRAHATNDRENERSPAAKKRKVLSSYSNNATPTSMFFEPYPCISPRKMSLAKLPNVTPKKLNLTSPKKFLPTTDLPDLVVNGSSPYARKDGENRKPRRALDWLTSLTQQRKTVKGMTPISAASSPTTTAKRKLTSN